jgi:NAD(P)-dependent dehydrogenase (short-subunit alcohol dehydrogenase family)
MTVDRWQKSTPLDLLPLAGKVAWVTGAGRGLGRAIALGLGQAGANVALTSRTTDDLMSLKAAITAGDREAVVIPGSVTQAHTMQAAADEVVASFGRLDILVNSAGISSSFARAEDVSIEVLQSIIEVNLVGTFICCREAGRSMLASGGGSIINISSVLAKSGFGRLSAYAASKGGVESMTRALAVEWAGRGVRVNCVAPGYFTTPLSEPMLLNDRLRQSVIDRTPMGRIGDPSELVGMVTFLASNAASFVTGATFAVDGGWTAA